eukprot:3930543-Prymnesium_polylepis.1
MAARIAARIAAPIAAGAPLSSLRTGGADSSLMRRTETRAVADMRVNLGQVVGSRFYYVVSINGRIQGLVRVAASSLCEDHDQPTWAF